MAHTPIFSQMMRSLALAIQGSDGDARGQTSPQRRRLLAGLGGGVLTSTLPALATPKVDGAQRVAIVGAGLAGLACADALARGGVQARLFEASTRAGGRCYSLTGFFPGQAAERGGEFIDTEHKAMIGYARQFGLTLEDVNKNPGAVFYYFDGRRYPESAVVEEFRVLVARMREDLRRVGSPTAAKHTADDQYFDFMNLRDYLVSRGAGPLAYQAIEQAYIAEFGLEIAELSCLAFLLYIRADRRSKFQPFGTSDERYHVIGGNDQIAQGLAKLAEGRIETGRRLVALRRETSGEYVLGFATGSDYRCDAVVLTIPFSVLRGVALDASLGLPASKQYAIQNLRYGTNAKMMLGFDGRPWTTLGSNGASYSDLPNHQTTWETDYARASTTRGVLTDYSGGRRGARLDPGNVQGEATAFLGDLDLLYPGALASATYTAVGYRAFLQHWPSNPLTLGAYTANHPGYFTTIADEEGKPVDRLHFAGEHTSSFYEYQGFMEGGLLSGQRAAGEVLKLAQLNRS